MAPHTAAGTTARPAPPKRNDTPDAAMLHALQRTAGNRAVSSHLIPADQRLTIRRNVQRDLLRVQRDGETQFARGHEDGTAGRVKRPGPLTGEALAAYDRGYAAGLDDRLQHAVREGNWPIAAETLNAFNTDDILQRLPRFSVQQVLQIEQGAYENPRVGPRAQVATLLHDVMEATHPEAYPAPRVFPNNFGDRLGPAGAIAVAAAGGLLAARLAAPLLANWWRTIVIRATLARAAAEADRRDAELLAMNLEQAIDRLMAGPGGRVLVTYQTAPPAADVELYLTSQQGAQYAEAVAAGRNLYQLRIPERLFQLLQQRGLLEVRIGSMGNQVGEDIRIAPGAMQYLSKYFREVPLR